MAQKVPDIESSGWIKLYRSLFFHEFADEPWNRITAWMYLVSLAAYKPYDAVYRRHVYHLERGQAAIVMSDLAMKAQWSKWRVKRFFDLLVKKNMVLVKGDFTCCVLTILNYEKYQSENAVLPATANATPTATAIATANDCPTLAIEDLLATANATPTATAIATQNKKSTKKEEKKSTLEDIVELPKIPYAEIISYLNLKANTKYRSETEVNRNVINARWHDKWILADFIKVIDNMVNAWGKDAKMVNFLRPQTLFGSKFESYLNWQSDVHDGLYIKDGISRHCDATPASAFSDADDKIWGDK